MKQGNEHSIQKALLDYAMLIGVPCLRRNVSTFIAEYKGKIRRIKNGAAGQSDLYGWSPKTGRHFELEVKAPGGKLSPAQEEWLKDCRRLGCTAGLAFSFDEGRDFLDAVKEGLV